MTFLNLATSGATAPKTALKWLLEVDKAASMDELQDSKAFETWDAKLASAFAKIIHGKLAKDISLIQERKLQEGIMLNGRQIWWLVQRHFEISELDGQTIEIGDLMAVTLHNDDLVKFLHDWEWVLLGLKTMPDEKWLEHLFHQQIKNSQQL